MLWYYVLIWALGACVIVYAFATAIGARKFGLGIVLFVVGVALVAASAVAGTRHNSKVHGVRPDEAPELTRPGGS